MTDQSVSVGSLCHSCQPIYIPEHSRIPEINLWLLILGMPPQDFQRPPPATPSFWRCYCTGSHYRHWFLHPGLLLWEDLWHNQVFLRNPGLLHTIYGFIHPGLRHLYVNDPLQTTVPWQVRSHTVQVLADSHWTRRMTSGGWLRTGMEHSYLKEWRQTAVKRIFTNSFEKCT